MDEAQIKDIAEVRALWFLGVLSGAIATFAAQVLAVVNLDIVTSILVITAILVGLWFGSVRILDGEARGAKQ